MSKRAMDTIALLLNSPLKLHIGENVTAAMFKTLHVISIPKIKWQNKFPDKDVIKRALMKSAYTLLTIAQLRWACRITRMPGECLPKNTLYREIQVVKCSQGGQKKRYSYEPKASRKNFNVSTESWQNLHTSKQCGVAS